MVYLNAIQFLEQIKSLHARGLMSYSEAKAKLADVYCSMGYTDKGAVLLAEAILTLVEIDGRTARTPTTSEVSPG